MSRCSHDPEFVSLERSRQGALDPAAAREALAHARTCAACSGEQRNLDVDRAMLAAPLPPAWSSERARKVARTALEAPPPALTRNLVFAAGLVAATAAIVVLTRPSPAPRAPRTEAVAAAPARAAAPAAPPSIAPPNAPSLGLVAGSTGIALGPDGSFRLERGALAGVSFADGSAVAIVGPARGAVTDGQGGPRVRLDQGVVECKVQPQHERRFVVDAGDTTVLVRGTRFVVQRDEDGVDVEVSEGRVDVTRAGQTTTLVPDGSARRAPTVEWLEAGAPCGPMAEEGGMLVVEGVGAVRVDGVTLGPAPLRTRCRAGDLAIDRRAGRLREHRDAPLAVGTTLRLPAMVSLTVAGRSASRGPGLALVPGGTATGGRAGPDAADDVVARARRLLADRRRDEARALLEHHLAARPSDWSALYWLGETQRLSGEPSAATASYERVADRAPGLLAQNALASLALLAQSRSPAAGLAAWDRYLARHPHGPVAAEALLGRAHALELLGRGPEARAAYERFLTLFPDHPRATVVRGRLDRP